MEAILYTLPDCPACKKAETYLENNDYSIRKIVMDDPVSKLGSQCLFNNRVYAPFTVINESDVFIFDKDFKELLKIKIA